MTKTTTKTRKPAAKAAKAPAKKTTARKAQAKKLTAAQADVIATSKGSGNGETHYVTSAGGDTLSFPTARWSGELRAASAVGKSFKECKALWSKLSVAKLARGVSSKDAPQSSKAVQDSAAKAKAAEPAKKGKAAAPAKGKAAPVKKARHGALEETAKISITDKGKAQIAKGADNGSTRNVIKLAKCKTVADAIKAGLNQADVKYAAKVGTITVG